MAKAPKKSSAKNSAVKSANKKSAAKSAAPKASSKKSAAKAAAKPAAKKPAKKPAAKPPVKATAKPAAKSSAAKTSAKKASPKATSTKSAVTQVTDALKSVANKVTSAFSSTEPKKKALNQETAKSPAPTLRGLKKIDLKGFFSPTDDRIVIERVGVSNRTAGGLYIPDTVSDSEKPNRGRVLAVGPGHRDKKGRLRPLDVQEGDLVIFDRYAGSEVTIQDQEVVLLRESEVVAIEKA
jgi:chaperonin GroES